MKSDRLMKLPPQITVFERGWLSSNNILISGSESTALIDSGYSTHSTQTLALVQHGLNGRSLDFLLNTHLHSDHCGGNARLQEQYPQLRTMIPPGLAQAVEVWDPLALTYTPTGQQCVSFTFSSLLQPQTRIQLGDLEWQIHAAPGHDTHSIILFEPESKTLISADALWENGFGVVFPELEGEHAFQEVADTLNLIESLQPDILIPGHGKIFDDAEAALAKARSRLQSFVDQPLKHAKYAGKVLLKFKLLEQHRLFKQDLLTWALQTPYLQTLHQTYFHTQTIEVWFDELLQDLIRSGAAKHEGSFIADA